MKTLGYLVIALVLTAAAGGQAAQSERWKVVCGGDSLTGERRCHLSYFSESTKSGTWLGIAVQHLGGGPEIQITSGGRAYRSAEINVESDTTIFTDYCFGSYCVFVRADSLVEQFREGHLADVRLYDGESGASVHQRVSLNGFTEAYQDYLSRIGQ